jgi:hypothetical protein
LTALQSDERANYQVDVKFQESYLKKVVDLLHCQLAEGAAVRSETNDVEMHNAESDNPSELEDGELPDSHGICSAKHDMQHFFLSLCCFLTFSYHVLLISFWHHFLHLIFTHYLT